MSLLETLLPQFIRDEIHESWQIKEAKKIGYYASCELLDCGMSKEDMNAHFKEIKDQLKLEGLSYHAMVAFALTPFTAMIQKAQGVDKGP